jgi:hypothetical protein
MNLLLLYTASVIGAFFGWCACGPNKATSARCIARASLIAFLCAPGVLVGHGVGLAATLFGLIHAMLMVLVLYADDTRYGLMQVIRYALFFAGAVINFVLCFRAVTSKNANP